MTCAPVSLLGLSSTGFMSTVGARPAACACRACARPISPPSAVTALLSAMFCGLNGATRTPARCAMRHRPATSVLLPASEVVPWIISVPRGGPENGEVDMRGLSHPPVAALARMLGCHAVSRSFSVAPARARAITPNSSRCSARARSPTSPPPERAMRRCNFASPCTARAGPNSGASSKSPCAWPKRCTPTRATAAACWSIA